jgi:lipopolysaccharide/colanic/teichoic acid biosynthesis glycosyltransferase
MIKRLFDVVVAALILVPALPIMLVVALLVRRYLGAPVIFSQTRPGLNGRAFSVLKFRTMNDARDDCGNLLSDDRRLTRFGLALRRSSLDELPQLFNVLRGDLSLVGPRPLLMEYLPLYSARQARRHDVRPGITGWAQVSGRNAISWERKFELDVWYTENQSFWLDMKILLLTVKRVLIKDGIGANGSDVVQRFEGSASAVASNVDDAS